MIWSIWSFVQLAWHFLFGWAGVDMLIGLAAVAVAVLVPPAVVAFIPELRKWAVCVAVVAFTLMGAIAYGYKNGSDEVRRQWDAALTREVEKGSKARADAERDVPDATSRGVFRSDPNNRDRGKHEAEQRGPVRWLGSHHLLGR